MISDRQIVAALTAYDEALESAGVRNLGTRIQAMRAALVAARPKSCKRGTVTCGAVQQSDEMSCAACGLRWDVNDPDPPGCRAKS